jgi:hypothetical protein
MREKEYAYRLHDRLTESDPELATVMYSTSGPSGPWWDMATCHPDWVDDILGALQWREDMWQAEREAEAARLRAEIEEADRG